MFSMLNVLRCGILQVPRRTHLSHTHRGLEGADHPRTAAFTSGQPTPVKEGLPWNNSIYLRNNVLSVASSSRFQSLINMTKVSTVYDLTAKNAMVYTLEGTRKETVKR